MLRKMINSCINDDVSKRPRFDTLAGEIQVELIKIYCEEEDHDSHKKAVEFIEQNEFPVNFQTIEYKEFSLFWACYYDRPLVVRALLTKGADPNLANNYVKTSLRCAKSVEVC